jgi:YD repeat-containing protein
MSSLLRCRCSLRRALLLGAMALLSSSARLWAQCPPAGFSESVRPANGATGLSGIVRVDITRTTGGAPYQWFNTAPVVDVYDTTPTHSLHAFGSAVVLGGGAFYFEFDAALFTPGLYEIYSQDLIWDPTHPLYTCYPPTTVQVTISPPLIDRHAGADKLRCPGGRDGAQTGSTTSPFTGSQSWTVPITSWAYKGATLSFGLIANSVSLVDPQATDPLGADPDEPLTPNFAGLSEKNSKWTHPYAQWIDLFRDETGHEYAVWHRGGGYLAFPNSATGFVSPDSYHVIASTDGTSSSTVNYPCNGSTASVTAPYQTFTITDADGTRYFFNQPQSGTGIHLSWTTANCTALPHYLLSRIEDRWGRAVNLTWSDVTVGAGTEKRCTAVRDAGGTGLTLSYPNSDGLLRSVTDPQGRTHSIAYTAVPDETLPTPVNRQKLTSVTVYGAGSPNRTLRTWTFSYRDASNPNLAYGGTGKYTGDLVIAKTEPDGLTTNYQYEGNFLDPADHTRPREPDWDGRVTRIAWNDSSEGLTGTGQSPEYAIIRTKDSATRSTLTYPSSDGVTLSIRYDYTGDDVTSVTDLATGRVWSYTYDGYHNLKTVRSPLEATGNPLIQFDYVLDSSGHVTQRTAQVRKDDGSLGDPVEVQFNVLNLPTQLKAYARAGSGNLDQVTQFQYDNGAPIVLGSPGNLTKVTEAVGRRSSRTPPSSTMLPTALRACRPASRARCSR